MIVKENLGEHDTLKDDQLMEKARKCVADTPKSLQSAKPGDQIIDDLSVLYPKVHKIRGVRV